MGIRGKTWRDIYRDGLAVFSRSGRVRKVGLDDSRGGQNNSKFTNKSGFTLIDFFTSDEIVEPQKGDLLISEPYLPDPNFERTVILICEHDENGSIGFVLNKKAQVGLGDVMDDLSGSEMNLFVGGPVQQDTLHFLHRSEKLQGDSNEVCNGVFWGGDYEKMTSMMNIRQLDETEIKFFIGYSGWSEGQLMHEMEQKSWIIYRKSSLEFIFKTPAEDLWKYVLREKGGKFKLISNYPTDPRLN